DKSAEFLKRPGIKIFDLTGRPMKNWFVASGSAVKSDKDLLELLTAGRSFAQSLPPKGNT
ncbi:MAG TPA: hypothetical protein VFW90_03915, partial [Candidatus Saccharimonadales bacterium]|nr:hypothetical protein [Candidatus Saccharimonadales bacterium]